MSTKNSRILVVDDQFGSRDALELFLQGEGYITDSADNGKHALMLIAERLPDLIVLDITMPGMDGCELARRLRAGADGTEVLIIALTALGDYNSLERIADAGFDLYFTKPVAPGELYAALNTFAERGRPPA